VFRGSAVRENQNFLFGHVADYETGGPATLAGVASTVSKMMVVNLNYKAQSVRSIPHPPHLLPRFPYSFAPSLA
jgi:hypothetical protein